MTDGPLTALEINTLAKYNSEVARGIMHVCSWQDKMREYQRRYDDHMLPVTSKPRPRCPYLPCDL